jgi:mRNA-degrading endonuclease RelE of RelBE toxin-antitoxin system
MSSGKNTEYNLIFSRIADSYLERQPARNRSRIIQRLILLANNPYSRELDIRLLEGEDGKYALRVGFYRIIYSIDRISKSINILMIGPRGDVYK